MRIAVAASGKWLDSEVDYHTGRAPFFIIYDTDSEDFEAIDNWRCSECVHWAGVQSVQALAAAGVVAVVVRHIGPNSYRQLREAGIGILYTGTSTVVRAIRRFREGALVKASGPNCKGHAHLHAGEPPA